MVANQALQTFKNKESSLFPTQFEKLVSLVSILLFQSKLVNTKHKVPLIFCIFSICKLQLRLLHSFGLTAILENWSGVQKWAVYYCLLIIIQGIYNIMFRVEIT